MRLSLITSARKNAFYAIGAKRMNLFSDGEMNKNSPNEKVRRDGLVCVRVD